MSKTPITDSATIRMLQDTAGEPPALVPYVHADCSAQLETKYREMLEVLTDIAGHTPTHPIDEWAESMAFFVCRTKARDAIAKALINADGTLA